MKKILVCLLAALLLTACAARQVVAPQEASVAPSQSSSGVLESEASEASEASEVKSDSSEQASEGTASASENASSAVPDEPLTVRVTIPEGYTLPKIGLTLEEKGVCTSDEFMAAAIAGDFSAYPLVAAQEKNTERCFALEGYLFPATYELYAKEAPDAILRRMLEHTEVQLTPAIREQIKASGYTVDEILTLASIIEKESFGAAEMPKVSSVLHNRLDSGMRLQCDVTIKYVEGAIKPFITGDKDRYNSYYNTYKCAALPAGAICNPGLAAIKAAISPEDTPYFYFLTDSEKNYLYSETFEEHQENVKKAGL